MKKVSSKLFLFVCAAMMVFSLSAFTKTKDPVSPKGLPGDGGGEGFYVICAESTPVGTHTWRNYYIIVDGSGNIISNYTIISSQPCGNVGGTGGGWD